MNLLITGAWPGAKEHIPALERMGHAVQFLQMEQEPLPCKAEWVEGVVCNGLFLHHPISEFRNLRLIQLTSAGFDRVPMEYCKGKGIRVENARGVYSIPMAEFAVAGVLSLYKQLPFFRANQQCRRWEKHRGLLELAGKTVCVLGCGSVGTECAKRFRAFGCRILGINRTVREDAAFDTVIPLEQLDGALPQADILILSLPLTEQTRGLIDASRLALLPRNAILVNLSRGPIVDQEALTAALPNLGGAALDVFNEEPLPEDSPLWGMENAVITPHNSFAGEGNTERLTRIIFQNMHNEA